MFPGLALTGSSATHSPSSRSSSRGQNPALAGTISLRGHSWKGGLESLGMESRRWKLVLLNLLLPVDLHLPPRLSPSSLCLCLSPRLLCVPTAAMTPSHNPRALSPSCVPIFFHSFCPTRLLLLAPSLLPHLPPSVSLFLSFSLFCTLHNSIPISSKAPFCAPSPQHLSPLPPVCPHPSTLSPSFAHLVTHLRVLLSDQNPPIPCPPLTHVLLWPHLVKSSSCCNAGSVDTPSLHWSSDL